MLGDCFLAGIAGKVSSTGSPYVRVLKLTKVNEALQLDAKP